MIVKEIEVKYLVSTLPDGVRGESKKVSQYYTKVEAAEEERYRAVNNEKFYKTIKRGQGLVREEIEHEVTVEEYENNKEFKVGILIEKTRCILPYTVEGKVLTIEVDIYEGELEGLVVAEVEFESVGESEKFKNHKPSWFLREVTEDKKYKNKNLAMGSNH